MFRFALWTTFLAAGFAWPHGSTLENRGATPNESELIHNAIEALGGRGALSSLSGVTYESTDIFRVNSLMQNYNLFSTDRYIIIRGSQNVSYSLNDDSITQRIDRDFQRSDYFIAINPVIPPGSFSLVMKSGSNGYACYNQGNNNVFIPAEYTWGYTDAALAEYLLFQAQKGSPHSTTGGANIFLININEADEIQVLNHHTTSTVTKLHDTAYPTVHDTDLNLMILLDPKTYLPHVIRSFEEHAIFGRSTSDLLLFNYTEVSGTQFPQRRMVLYNEDAILEDTTVSNIEVNPSFSPEFFDGLPEDESATPRVAPRRIQGYSHAEIGEWWSNTLWTGEYTGTLANLSITHPAKDLPGAHLLLFEDASGVEQLVLEFEDSVIVYEAPAHQTDLVIQWVKQTLNKPITHYWPSHHHHDHNYEAKKFVELGAKVIVPKIAAAWWQQIPNIELIQFSEEEPYVHSDGKMQARFLWRPEAVHSVDWTYSVVMPHCPSQNSSMLAYVADTYSTSIFYDDVVARSWLEQALADGMSRDTIVVPAHGTPAPVRRLIDGLAFDYPPFNAVDFKTGGPSCLG